MFLPPAFQFYFIFAFFTKKSTAFSDSIPFLIIIIATIINNHKHKKKPNKKSSNEVNVLNWSSYIPYEIINDFQDETGIKVNYGTYSSNEELLAKISSSKEGTYDLIFPSDYMIELMISKHMLDEIDKNKITNFNKIIHSYIL